MHRRQDSFGSNVPATISSFEALLMTFCDWDTREISSGYLYPRPFERGNTFLTVCVSHNVIVLVNVTFAHTIDTKTYLVSNWRHTKRGKDERMITILRA